MAAVEEITRAALEALEAEESLERAVARLQERFPGKADTITDVITSLLGGDVFIPGAVPEPGTLRAKFWAEIVQR